MLDVIENILAARSAEQVWQRYVSTLTKLGFPHVSYHGMRLLRSESARMIDDSILLSSHSPRLLHELLSQNLLQNSPMYRWIERNHGSAKYGGVGIDGFLGFQLIGGAITGVTLRGRTVIIDHTGAPSGIRYAMQSQDVSGNAGNRYNAHRGLLRTTLQKPSKLVPGRMLQRAVPSFTLEL